MKSKNIKQSKAKKVLNWLKPTSLRKGMLVFAIAFALIGGSYTAYRSFATTSPWLNQAVFFQCPNINGIPGTIQEGNTGNCVKLAQYTLIHFAGQNIALDGQFGPATKNAVINLQRISGLSATGVVNTATWFTMVVLVNNHTASSPSFNPQTILYYCSTPRDIYNKPLIHLNGGQCDSIQVAELVEGNEWYGPYRTMTVPAGAQGISACFVISGTGAVAFHYDIADNHGHVLKYGDSATDSRTENGITKCIDVAGTGTFSAVEDRIYPTSSGKLFIYNTRLSYY
jgi:hypothetical protein